MRFLIGILVVAVLYRWMGITDGFFTAVGLIGLLGIVFGIRWLLSIKNLKANVPDRGSEQEIQDCLKSDDKETKIVLKPRDEDAELLTEKMHSYSDDAADMPKVKTIARRSLSEQMARKKELVDDMPYTVADLLDIDNPEEEAAHSIFPNGIAFPEVYGQS